VIATHLVSNNLEIVGNTTAFSVTISEAISVASGTGDLTIGAAGNTGTATVSAAVSTRGDIVVNVGTFTLDNGINLSTATASDITIQALGNFGTTGATRRTISSAGGNITIHADSDANGSGQLDLDYLTLDPGAGNIIIRGETFSWTIAADTDKPYINGTGSFTLEPGDAAFGGPLSTSYFMIDQDGNGLNGITLGKSGNTAAVTINTALTVAGPVTVYGSAIGITVNVTTNGKFLVRSTTYIDQSGSSTITTNGGDVIYWAGGSGESYIRSGTILTNGGHIFMGGDFAALATRVWHGNTVGGGYNFSAGFAGVALRGNIDTRVTANQSIGGDVLLAGESGNSNAGDIEAEGANRNISAGNGSITFMPFSEQLQTVGNSLQMIVETTGKISVAPISGSNFWTGQTRTYNGSMSGTTFNGSSALTGLQILNFANIGGWELGTYSGTGVSGDTPYDDANIKSMRLDVAFTVAGPIKVKGNSVQLFQPLETTGAGSSITIKSDGRGTGNDNGWLYAVNNLTTNGGDIVLWSNTANRIDGTANNELILEANVAINSNGGKIVLAGGLDDGSNGGTANDGIPDGYAFRGVNSGEGAITLRNNISLLSDGGDIIFRGQYGTGGGSGISSEQQLLINAGTGSITINGLAAAGFGLGFDRLAQTPNIAITSASTQVPAIRITGTTTANNWGINFSNSTNAGNYLIQSTASTGGGVSITGISNGTYGFHNRINNGRSQILSVSGDITISTSSTSGTSGSFGVRSQNGFYIGERFDATAVNGITPVSGFTGKITLTTTDILDSEDALILRSAASGGDNILIRANSFTLGTGSQAATSGTLTVEPSSTSFSSAIIWPLSNLTVGSAITGLTLGKSGNTSGITLSTAQTINGPISLYGGTLTLNENLTAQSAGNITLFGNALTIASGKTISSSGRLQIAPTTVTRTIGVAGATGDLSLPATYFTSNFTDGFSSILLGSDNQTGAVSMNALTLQDPLELNTLGSLTLGGLVTLGSNDVTLNSRIASVTASASGYFQTNGTGKVNRNIANGGSFQLPVGNSSYNPLTIANNSGAADDFAARVLDAVYDGGTTGTAITDKVVKRTWDISKTLSNGGSGIDMTFEWAAADEVNMSAYRLSHFGTFWAPAVGTSGSPSVTTTKTMTHTGYTGSFSPFAIGSTSGALPVSWIDFTATRQGQVVDLHWRTASEQNTKDFVVQHRAGNGSWKNIGNVAAAGNSNRERSYRFTHSQPVEGRNLYRLLQRDLDGKESLSKVVTVEWNASASMQVYPIPSMNGRVYVKLPSNQVLRLMSPSGVVVWQTQGAAGVQLLDLTALPKGMYYLKGDTDIINLMLQ
jgi:hypothetical protein